MLGLRNAQLIAFARAQSLVAGEGDLRSETMNLREIYKLAERVLSTLVSLLNSSALCRYFRGHPLSALVCIFNFCEFFRLLFHCLFTELFAEKFFRMGNKAIPRPMP